MESLVSKLISLSTDDNPDIHSNENLFLTIKKLWEFISRCYKTHRFVPPQIPVSSNNSFQKDLKAKLSRNHSRKIKNTNSFKNKPVKSESTGDDAEIEEYYRENDSEYSEPENGADVDTQQTKNNSAFDFVNQIEFDQLLSPKTCTIQFIVLICIKYLDFAEKESKIDDIRLVNLFIEEFDPDQHQMLMAASTIISEYIANYAYSTGDFTGAIELLEKYNRGLDTINITSNDQNPEASSNPINKTVEDVNTVDEDGDVIIHDQVDTNNIGVNVLKKKKDQFLGTDFWLVFLKFEQGQKENNLENGMISNEEFMEICQFGNSHYYANYNQSLLTPTQTAIYYYIIALSHIEVGSYYNAYFYFLKTLSISSRFKTKLTMIAYKKLLLVNCITNINMSMDSGVLDKKVKNLSSDDLLVYKNLTQSFRNLDYPSLRQVINSNLKMFTLDGNDKLIYTILESYTEYLMFNVSKLFSSLPLKKIQVLAKSLSKSTTFDHKSQNENTGSNSNGMKNKKHVTLFEYFAGLSCRDIFLQMEEFVKKNKNPHLKVQLAPCSGSELLSNNKETEIDYENYKLVFGKPTTRDFILLDTPFEGNSTELGQVGKAVEELEFLTSKIKDDFYEMEKATTNKEIKDIHRSLKKLNQLDYRM
ncbi:hypothetical protein BB558_002910 [Smittium angustum]|uniref:PCI domain-containing protein n=1 Tax=Smittium angustum TaxID=133377 RepID=A0A2U1J7H6_SMIAN|nr:hypothetical protein BB558_002910 [Smittium angustum]